MHDYNRIRTDPKVPIESPTHTNMSWKTEDGDWPSAPGKYL